MIRTQDELLKVGIYEHDSWLYLAPNVEEEVESRQSYSRVILCIALLAFWCRILHIFSVIRILGPKLVMIGRMVSVVKYFIQVSVAFFAKLRLHEYCDDVSKGYK